MLKDDCPQSKEMGFYTQFNRKQLKSFREENVTI